MTTVARVILITVVGPGGQADVGVRSDATPAALATALPTIIGAGVARISAEHYGPSRPGAPAGRRVSISSHISLGESGVVDGDVLLFKTQDENPRSQAGRPGRLPEPAVRQDVRPGRLPEPVVRQDAGHRPTHRRP